MGIFSKKKKSDATDKPVKEDKKIAKKQPVQAKEDLTLAQLEEKESKTAKPGKKQAPAKVGKQVGLSYKWILRPVITEKATYLGAENKYVFEVSLKANKIEIRKAIEKLYNVNVVKINIIRHRGKKVTYGRISGITKRTKKAVVTLKPGQSISVYEGV